MLFAVICTDRPDGGPIRAANRPAHLDWLKAGGERIKLAGPFLAPDQQSMTGSLLVIEAEDEAAARALAATDPYAQAGLFADVAFKHWRCVVAQL